MLTHARTLLLCAAAVISTFSCIQPTDITEKPMVILTCSYNNAAYYKDNLRSILNQKYNNYRIVYVDDASPDNTGTLVEEYLKEHDTRGLVTLIKNTKRCGAAENFYRTIHSLNPKDIVVVVDGDDELANEEALSKVNATYQDPDVWMTYGNFLPKHMTDPIPNGCSAQVPDYVIEQNTFRYIPTFTTSHLRTHYAWLYQEIKKEDLMVDGEFWKVAPDYANMIPMLEMAGRHSRFIKDILYIYNNQNPINESRVTEMHHLYHRSTAHFQTLPRYQPLDERPSLKPVDLIIFSYDRPMQLYAYLESLQDLVSNIHQIFVLCKTSNTELELSYREVQEDFPFVEFVYQQPNVNDFKGLLISPCFARSSAPYLMFGVDDIIMTEAVNIRHCITALEKTSAYGFYLRLGNNIKHAFGTNPVEELKIPEQGSFGNNMIEFPFTTNSLSNPWQYPHSVDMVIFDKEVLRKPFEVLPYKTPNELEFHWSRAIPVNADKTGLCFTKSAMVNIPLNVVNPLSGERHMHFASTKELLDLFMAGVKIDTKKFYHHNNTTVHHEYQPTFTLR